jgi:hypothetical protein
VVPHVAPLATLDDRDAVDAGRETREVTPEVIAGESLEIIGGLGHD